MDVEKILTAKDARKITDSYQDQNFFEILNRIEKCAKKGESTCYVYESLTFNVKKSLEQLGYEVVSASDISIQKDDLHYTIK